MRLRGSFLCFSDCLLKQTEGSGLQLIIRNFNVTFSSVNSRIQNASTTMLQQAAGVFLFSEMRLNWQQICLRRRLIFNYRRLKHCFFPHNRHSVSLTWTRGQKTCLLNTHCAKYEGHFCVPHILNMCWLTMNYALAQCPNKFPVKTVNVV